MNETYVTVVGNVASSVTRRRTMDGTELASFRMASNVRRFDRDSGTWHTAATSFYTVTAWRQLGLNTAATFVKGDPVVVHGRMTTRDYVTKDGVQRTDVEIDANVVGPDLSRCTAALSRPNRPAGEAPAATEADAAESPAVDEPEGDGAEWGELGTLAATG